MNSSNNNTAFVLSAVGRPRITARNGLPSIIATIRERFAAFCVTGAIVESAISKTMLILSLGLLIICASGKANATTCSVPNSFTNGTIASAPQVNANFSALVTCGNTIDNTNIGPLGIYASQIIPLTGGQATFGGSVGYTFSNGLTVNGGLTLGTPLSVANGGTGSATQNFVDLTTNQAIAGAKSFSSAITSTVTAGSADAFILNNGVTNTTGVFANSSTSVGGVNCQALCIAQNGGFNLMSVDNSGNVGAKNILQAGAQVVGSNTAGGTRTYVPPVYTSAGAAVASTLHGVIGSFTTSTGTGSIVVGGSATLSSQVTFSGAAAFSSAPACSLAPSTFSGYLQVVIEPVPTTTAMGVLFINASSSAASVGAGSTIYYSCWGV